MESAYRRARRQLRPVRRWAEEVRYPMRRRNRVDDEHIRLLLALTLREDANCIDVGANDGAVLQSIVELAPHGRHVAYEPIPEVAAGLQQRFPSVDVHDAAASDTGGTATFAHVLNDEARSGLRLHNNFEFTPKVESIEVRLERLDDLPDDYVPDVIKIDVEGAELHVMQGGARMIAAHRPTILFEHYQGGSEVYGTTPEAVWEFLTATGGYRVFDIDGAGPLTAADLRARFDSRKVWQFVAHA